jgi:Ser-tRNA(Ala) deacylase AlaX
MTEKLYLAHPAMRATDATIVAHVTAADGRKAIRLDRTVFHAQGGGQKADRGRIGEARVIHVAHNGGEVDHIVDSPELLLVGSVVHMEVDDAWRRLNAAYHTSGHLIASVVERLFPGAKAVSGHQWPGEGRVEFEGVVPAERKADIESALCQAIADGLPVSILGNPYRDRSIGIGDMDAIACGGTHVECLSAIASIQIRSINTKKGRVRINYDAFAADAQA